MTTATHSIADHKVPFPADLGRLWAAALVIIAVTALTFESIQHGSFLGRGVIWFHSLIDFTLSIITFAAILYYVKWREQASAAQEAVERLQASERAREDLTAMLIHDLKNPLVSSMMALQAVLRRQERETVVSDEELQFLRLAQESQSRLSHMIEDLLVIAQAEGQAMPLDLTDVDVCHVIQRALRELAAAAEKAELQLVNECHDLPRVHADRHKIRRLLDNLLTNAMKFTPRGGRITVSGETAEGQVRLSVSDTGAGIPEEVQGRIFEKFGQATGGRRMSVGLGLTFCKLVAETHGGHIALESAPGQGSRFIVTLPLAPAKEPSGDAGLGAPPISHAG